jgi:hypothetical protein
MFPDLVSYQVQKPFGIAAEKRKKVRGGGFPD